MPDLRIIQDRIEQDRLNDIADKAANAECFRQGYADAQAGRKAHGFTEKQANAAYQRGYVKGGKGLAVKL